MSRWVKIVCNRLTGCVTVTGDCAGMFGVSPETLSRTTDPRPLLPEILQEAFDDPSVPLREDARNGLLVTACENSTESVFIAVAVSGEMDSVYPDLPAGVISLDHTGVLRHCNRAMGEMFGFDPGVCIGSEVAAVLPQPVLYSWNSVLKSVMMGHQVKVEFLPAGGRKNRGMLVRGGSGIVGLFHDITEVMETEKRLRAVQKMNKAIFSASEAGIMMFDVKGRVLLTNRAMARIAGHSNSLVGVHIRDVFPDEPLKWVDRSYKNLLARPGKGAISGDMIWLSGTGEERVVRLSLQSITDDAGAVTHIMGYVDDITEQVQGMSRLEALGRSLENLADLTTLLPGARRIDRGSAALLREILESDAIAVYINDPFAGLVLFDKDGAWPEGLPTADFHELRFPSFPGFGRPSQSFTGDKLGVLADIFRRGTIVPLGGDENPMGFILAVYGADQASLHREMTVGELAGALLTSGLMLHREHSETEKLAYLLRGRDRYFDELFRRLPIPAFVFSESGEIQLWNDDMTILVGEDGFSLPVAQQQRCLEGLLSGLGSISEINGRFSRGEPMVQGSLVFDEGEETKDYRLQIVKIRAIGIGADESVFLASALPEDGETAVPGLTFTLLGALMDVYESTDPAQVLRRGAKGALKLTGADAVRLSVDRIGSASAPMENWPGEPEWETEITHEGNRLVFQFAGGNRTSNLETLGRSVLKITGRMSSILTPSRLEKITGIPGGLMMITDFQGRVLFSNWPETVMTEGGYSSVDAFLGAPPPKDAMASLQALGSCTWLHPVEGPVRGLAMSGESPSRILWYPSRGEPEEKAKHLNTDLMESLVNYLLTNARRSRFSLDSLMELLEGRDPLRGLANTLMLDQGTALEALGMLRLAAGSTAVATRPARLEECLHHAMGMLQKTGVRVPDMVISEGLPEVVIEPEWMAEILARLLSMPESPGKRLTVEYADGWVVVDLPVILESTNIPGLPEVLKSLVENHLDFRVETGVSAALLEEHGCRLELKSNGALRVLIPALE